jgi:hypothetical protein
LSYDNYGSWTVLGDTGSASITSGFNLNFIGGTNVTTSYGGGNLTINATTETHPLLDASIHSDTSSDTVTRGSIIVGNATPLWDELVIGSGGTFLRSNGTDPTWQSIVTADISDITATAAELNLLDLAGLTAGWVLAADTATTASWQQLNTSDINNDSGFITGNETITLSSDVTGSGTTSIIATIANDAVTYAKMQNVVANNVFLGNNSGAGAIVDELTMTEATAMLNIFTDALQGLVPASGGGTTTFLRADGTFATPAGGFADFDVGGDSGSNVTVDSEDLLDIVGGTALTTSVSKVSTTVTLSVALDNTTVSTGSYGSASEFVSFTVDQQGRLTAASEGNISIPLSQVNDITATASELNLLDLAGLTTGWVLAADGASSASWQQLNTSDINNDSGFVTSNIYTGNGTLTGNRVLDGDSNTYGLTFADLTFFNTSNVQTLNLSGTSSATLGSGTAAIVATNSTDELALSGDEISIEALSSAHILIDVDNDSTSEEFVIGTDSTTVAGSTRLFTVDDSGQIIFDQYGSNNFTGTAAYYLGVDASGNIIEEPVPSGSANTLYNADDTIGSGRVATITDTIQFNEPSINTTNTTVFTIDGTYSHASGTGRSILLSLVPTINNAASSENYTILEIDAIESGIGGDTNYLISASAKTSAVWLLDNNGKIDNTVGLNDSTGDEIGHNIDITVSKVTSGSYIGFKMDVTESNVNGGNLLMQLLTDSSEVFSIDPTGLLAFADGVRQTFNPNGTTAGLNFGSHTADPSSGSNGDVYYNSTTNKFRGYENGSWADLISAGGGGNAYATVNGDTGSVSASGEETLSILGGGGISTNAVGGSPDTLTVSLDIAGTTTGDTVVTDDEFIMHDTSLGVVRAVSAQLMRQSFAEDIDVTVLSADLTIQNSNESTYAGDLITVNSTGGTRTITLNSDVTTGKQFAFAQITTGNTVSFAAGAGVTLIAKDDNLNFVGIGSTATATKISSTEYLIVGDLE